MQAILFADVTTRKLSKTLGGSAVVLPSIVQGDQVRIGLRFSETGEAGAVEIAKTATGVRASIGFVDARPTSGKFLLRVGAGPYVENTNQTPPIAFDANAASVEAALVAIGVTNCEVIAADGSWIISNAGAAITLSAVSAPGISDELRPASFARIRSTVSGGEIHYELRLIQTPLASVSTFDLVVPPAPSITRVQEGGTDSSVIWPEVQALKILPGFRGTYIIKRGFSRTSELSIDDGPEQIAAALAEIADEDGEFTVTNPATNIAHITFLGSMSGIAQDLLEIVVFSAPAGDPTVILDLNTAEVAAALRAADEAKPALEIEVTVEDENDAASTYVLTPFRAPVTLIREINWSGMEAAANIDWLRPPHGRTYIPFTEDQIISGAQNYVAPVGDAVNTEFTLTHNLGTRDLHVTVRRNSGAFDVINDNGVYGPEVAASVTIDPTGADNSVLYTAATAGFAGNDISLTYATPAVSAVTDVGVATNAITVTPGTKARMVITGTLSPEPNLDLFYGGTYNGKAYWSADGTGDGWNTFNTAIYYDGAKWVIQHFGLGPDYIADSGASAADYPDGLSFTPTTGTGTPTVTAGISSAEQVIAAVNDDVAASALVTASASGTVTGAVAAVAQTYLTGGLDSTQSVSVLLDSEDDLTLVFAGVPNADEFVVTVSTAGPESVFQEHTHTIAQIVGLDTILDDLGSRIETLESIVALPGAAGSNVVGQDLVITLPEVSILVPPASSASARPPLLGAVHDGTASVATPPLTGVLAALGTVQQIDAAWTIPASINRREWPVADDGYVASNGEVFYEVRKDGNSYFPVEAEHDLFMLWISAAMFPVKRALALDVEPILQLLGNTRAQYILEVAFGTLTEDTGTGYAMNLADITWATPVISERILLSAAIVPHPIGITVASDFEGTLTATAAIYGRTQTVTAPASNAFAIRARLLNFDTENRINPRGIVLVKMEEAAATITPK